MMNIVFDARVIQDHFPGIGRYAYNLLAELPELLRGDETLTVLHDPSAKNTRYRLPPPQIGGKVTNDQWSERTQWVEYTAPIFGMKNVLTTPPILNPKSPVIPVPFLGTRNGIGEAIGNRQSAIVHYPYYVRPRASRPPSVTTIYDAISFVYPDYTPSAQARLSIRLLHQMAIAASRAVITISQSAANDLTRFFPSARDKLVVTPLAPDPIFTPQSLAAITAVRARLDLPHPFTLYLASNKPHKNLVRLVEAWHMVIRDWRLEIGQSPLLVIAGRHDPRYPQAQQRVKALGLEQRVRFIGPVSDAEAAALYSACDLFVCPSLYEGFGLTPLEAMACGAPVACSNASSLPEIAGDAAIMFDPAKLGEIVAACARILNDSALRADMRRRSQTQAARFSWSETARSTIEVYRDVSRIA